MFSSKKKIIIELNGHYYYNYGFAVHNRHRGEGGAGGTLAPPLFWLIKLLFQFFSKVLHKKVHRVILCQTCGPQRKHCFFLIFMLLFPDIHDILLKYEVVIRFFLCFSLKTVKN